MANKSRPKQLSFRVSEEEWGLLQQKISESGMNQQQYILSCVLGKEIVNTDGIKEIVPELKRQGANLKENAELKKQNEQLKQVCADTGEMISNFKKETERLQKQKKLLIGVVNTLMEKCMGVTEETQDIQTKKSFFGRVKGLTWERWQRIINAVTALGATVQACNRTLKAQPKAVVERKKSIRVQLQEIKEKHGMRD